MIQDQLKQLFELNEVDRKIDEIRARVVHLPERRAELEGFLKDKQEGIAGKKERVSALEKEKREIEGELQLSQSRLKEFQERVNLIKTNKEYQAALKEIGETKQMNKVMEDRLLKIMAELEGLSKEVGEVEAAGQAEITSAETELSTLEEQEKGILGEVQVFAEKRQSLLAAMERPLLAQYERVRKSKEDAVVRVEGGTCQGCHMNIPAQLFIEIQKVRSIHSCPSCHRLLYISGGNS